MGNASYIVTANVRHLATWQAKERTDTGYVTGRSQPICGRYAETFWQGDDSPPSHHLWFDDTEYERYEADMKKPLCKMCLKVLASLNQGAT